MFYCVVSFNCSFYVTNNLLVVSDYTLCDCGVLVGLLCLLNFFSGDFFGFFRVNCLPFFFLGCSFSSLSMFFERD